MTLMVPILSLAACTRDVEVPVERTVVVERTVEVLVEVEKIVEKRVEVVVTPTPTSSSAPDPLSVVDGWIEAFNAGDVAALARYYAEDLVLYVGPFGPEGEFDDPIGKAHLLEQD